MRQLIEENLQKCYEEGGGDGVAVRMPVLHLPIEDAEEGAQRRHEVARMQKRRGRFGQEKVFGQTIELQPFDAAVVEPESLCGICTLVVENALIVDEDIAALHVIHAAADADVSAPLADQMQF